MVRSNGWLALAALAGVFAANGAQAQECSSDDDCPTSTRCEWATSDDVGNGSSGDAIALPCENPECTFVGSCQPLPRGECESNSDCADGRECIKATSVTDCPVPAPEPGGDGKEPGFVPPEECESGEETERYGICSVPLVECQSDADCANGLTCILSGSSSGSSGSSGGGADPGVGGAPLPPDEERPGDIIAEEPAATGYCGWIPQDCDDAPCADGFACVEDASSGVCSSAGAPPCAPGSECVSDPAEPDCTYEVEKICVPELAPCEDDGDCSEDWECVEFSSDGSFPIAPEFWNASGLVKSCVPSGLATEVENGNPGFGGNGFGTGTIDNDSGNPETPSESGGEAKSSSGCSVGSTGSFGAFSGFVLAGLALVRRRRNRR